MRIEFETGKLPRLLVIDDDEGITDFIKNVTEEMNFSVNCVHDYESIGNTYNEFNPDIIFLDLCLPGYDGVEVLHFLADMGCKSKIFLISGIDKITLNSAGDVGKLWARSSSLSPNSPQFNTKICSEAANSRSVTYHAWP